MKKACLYLSAVLFISTSFFIIFIKSNGETFALTPETVSKDEAFILLNEVLNRFDPAYSILVWHDKRSAAEIITRRNTWLLQLKNDPGNRLLQQQLADLFHFSSVEEFEKYRETLSESLEMLTMNGYLRKIFSESKDSALFYSARKMYAKNTIDAYPACTKKPVTFPFREQCWMDFVKSYFNGFEYMAYIYSRSYTDEQFRSIQVLLSLIIPSIAEYYTEKRVYTRYPFHF